MLLHLIADYGPGDLAYAEVRQRLATVLPDADVIYTPVPPFDTVSAGFCIAQLALTDGPADRLIYSNVAPRADVDDPRPGNEGERLLAARLATGATVVGVDAGHVFSLIRSEVLTLDEVEIPATGSQFRSRDAFPSLLPAVLAGTAALVGPVDREQIPPAPDRSVLYVDGYGNLKTSWTTPPAELGSRVTIRIGDHEAEAMIGDGTFDVPAGTLAFAPGSSGWSTRDGRELRWYEILLRGGNAATTLGSPNAGALVELKP